MKNLNLSFVVFSFFFTLYSQETKICWQDYSGREFCLTNITARFSYTMISGDRMEYEPSYSDNSGKVKKIGNVRIEYEPSYSDNAGKIRKIGNVRIEYEPSYSDNAGKIRKIGGLRIQYEPNYSNAAGKIRRTYGSVN